MTTKKKYFIETSAISLSFFAASAIIFTLIINDIGRSNNALTDLIRWHNLHLFILLPVFFYLGLRNLRFLVKSKKLDSVAARAMLDANNKALIIITFAVLVYIFSLIFLHTSLKPLVYLLVGLIPLVCSIQWKTM